MKNYFEHETKVKIQEHLLAKSPDWQWLIQHIEENFDLSDIKNWIDYENKSRDLFNILDYFIRISNITDKEFLFSSNVLRDIYTISQFVNSTRNTNDTLNNIKSIYGKVLFLFEYILKIENKDNNTDYIADNRIYRTKNFWELINFDNLILHFDDIQNLMSQIDIDGFAAPKQCILDNLNKVYFPKNPEFIKKYENNFVNANAFEHQLIKYSDPLSWQEEYLLDMLKVRFSGKEIIPLSEFYGRKNPDFTLWTEDIITKLKNYFSDEFPAQFVLETIDYVMHNNRPSDTVIQKHFELMSQSIEENTDDIDIHCSSFKIISRLFKDKFLDDIKNKEFYKNFIKSIQEKESPEVIENLKNNYIPISKKQSNILFNIYKNSYKEIDNIVDLNNLSCYLKNENNIKFITLEYLKKVWDKFNFIISQKPDISTAILFCNFMDFLIEMKSKNLEINKHLIEANMVELQKLWQHKYFIKIKNSLHSYSEKAEISNDDIEAYNNTVLKNPYYLVLNCMSVHKEKICKSLELTAQYPLRMLCTNVLIEKVFPKIHNVEKLSQNHDIDKILLEIIKETKNQKGYRLINCLEDKYFLWDLHYQWESNVHFNIGIFNKTKELYNEIKQTSPVELLPFGRLTIGHIAQLFPVLEIKIRELGSLGGIFPFKENDFMKYKDPSSILICILTDIYNEIKDLLPVNDLFFVYNVMYNSNSLNVRNEFIHGRKYFEKNNLDFVFKLTLICIKIIQKRIDAIMKNEHKMVGPERLELSHQRR